MVAGDAPDAHGSLFFTSVEFDFHIPPTFPLSAAGDPFPEDGRSSNPSRFSCDPVHHRMSNHWMILLSVKKYTSFRSRYQYINTGFPEILHFSQENPSFFFGGYPHIQQ